MNWKDNLPKENRYFETENGILYNNDCLDIMKHIPKESIDLVITDPPYNISRETNFHTMKGRRGTVMDFGEWDKNADILSYIHPLSNVLNVGSNVVIFNCWENLGNIAKIMKSNDITPKRCLVLNKSNPAPFNRDRLFVNDVEFAIWGVYKNKKWVFNRQDKLEKCIFGTTVQSKKYHPTMKDIKVIIKLVEILSNPNQIVIDPFLGSGTTAIACEKLNRRWIGIELSEDYCEIAKTRIKAVSNNLFK